MLLPLQWERAAVTLFLCLLVTPQRASLRPALRLADPSKSSSAEASDSLYGGVSEHLAFCFIIEVFFSSLRWGRKIVTRFLFHCFSQLLQRTRERERAREKPLYKFQYKMHGSKNVRRLSTFVKAKQNGGSVNVVCYASSENEQWDARLFSSHSIHIYGGMKGCF